VITVAKAPPYLTVQDLGWSDLRSSGMPVGGAMDRWALAAANLLVGNARDAAAFEWALAGGAIRFERASSIALTGAEVVAAVGGKPVPPRAPIALAAGETLSVERLVRGRFLYIAIAGGVDVPPLLGSRSTGRRLKTGDVVSIGTSSTRSTGVNVAVPAELLTSTDAISVRVIEGPQRAMLPERAWRGLLDTTFTVSPTSDRMGYRLTAPGPITGAAADLPSEPACAGAIQLPPDGHPIVLMADGPTVGGYPKIAVVISADLPRIAQRNPGETVRFRVVSVEEAQAAYRRVAVQLDPPADAPK
jgi:biotin-dependent carboxylase-like uncharacterized protein